MRSRIPAIILGVCLLVPMLFVMQSQGVMHDLQSDVTEVRHEMQSAPAFVALREARELRRAFIALETELSCVRLEKLPDDAAQWHTSLIVQPDWQTREAEKLAVAALDREPHLKAIKARTHFHLLKTDDAVYRKGFAKECPLTPCLLITRADGSVIYKESGSQLGKKPRALYCAISAEIRRHCPDGR